MSELDDLQKSTLRLIKKVRKERESKTMKAKLKKFFEAIVDFATSRKFYVALIGALLQLIPIFIEPQPEWYGVLVAFFTAIGVYSIPNAKK